MVQEDRYVKFLIKNKLTQTQFLLLHLLYKKKYNLITDYKKAFPSDNKSMIGKYLTEDLINRGFLIKITDRKGKVTYTISEKFLDVYVNEYIAMEEIFEIYPSFYTKENNVTIPLTSMDRNVFSKIYIDKIAYSRGEHDEIKKDIEYGKEHELLVMGIEKFLKSEFWKSLRELRLKDDVIKLDTNKYEDF